MYIYTRNVELYCIILKNIWASEVVLVIKNLSASTGNVRGMFDPWVGKIP